VVEVEAEARLALLVEILLEPTQTHKLMGCVIGRLAQLLQQADKYINGMELNGVQLLFLLAVLLVET
jgi:hypothetical protein